MITYRCQHCQRPLEVDDDLAGKQAACPHCGGVSDVPLKSAQGVGIPLARAAGGRMDVAAGDEEDRALAKGLPPDSGPEQHVMTVHPVMFRGRPGRGFLLVLLLAGGLTGVGWGLYKHVLWLEWAGGIFAVLSGLWWVVWKVQASSVALIITNKRTTERRGLLSRQTKEILHDKVQDLQVTQSFPQRLLRTGSVGISNAGETGVEILVADLPNPMKIRDVIDAYREVG